MIIKIIGIITLLLITIFVILGTRESLLHKEGYTFLYMSSPILLCGVFMIGMLLKI